jgi:hypothetical protein
MLIVILVLIGIVLYISRAMKTTEIKKVGGEHTKLGCFFHDGRFGCHERYPPPLTMVMRVIPMMIVLYGLRV